MVRYDAPMAPRFIDPHRLGICPRCGAQGRLEGHEFTDLRLGVSITYRGEIYRCTGACRDTNDGGPAGWQDGSLFARNEERARTARNIHPSG